MVLLRIQVGWFFGFKLHVAVDEKGNILGFHISSANHHDRRHAEKLIEVGVTNKVVGDQHYSGKPLVAEMKTLDIQIVSYTKKKKNKADEQDKAAKDSKQDEKLLGKRSVVESTAHCNSKCNTRKYLISHCLKALS